MIRRRSCLTVPGDDERKLTKAASSAADQVVIDLEDAVPGSQKALARDITRWAVRELSWTPRSVSIRVNGPRDVHHIDDIELVRTLPVVSVVIPKVEAAKDLPSLTCPLEILIETASALAHCELLAEAPGVQALILGPADLAASLGTPTTTVGVGAHLDYARARVLVAARAGGCAAIDGPYGILGDNEGLRTSAETARSLGYDGKWCIHPEQLPVCTATFTATPEELAWARQTMESDGATRLAGEMIDTASRRLAMAILARA